MREPEVRVVTRWDGVHVVRSGRTIAFHPFGEDAPHSLARKMDGEVIPEERAMLDKYPGSVLTGYSRDIPVDERTLDDLRRVALSLAELRMASAFAGDEDIIWGIRVLGELKERANTLREMVLGWERVHLLAGTNDEGSSELGALLGETERTIFRIERFVKARMKSVAGELCEVCGPMLGAQLIECAGGLRRLAVMPSSSIQVLGARKAMFRHLRHGSPPPKHGVIFLHPEVMSAPKRLRGKRARSLASRIAFAARRDVFLRERVR